MCDAIAHVDGFYFCLFYGINVLASNSCAPVDIMRGLVVHAACERAAVVMRMRRDWAAALVVAKVPSAASSGLPKLSAPKEAAAALNVLGFRAQVSPGVSRVLCAAPNRSGG